MGSDLIDVNYVTLDGVKSRLLDVSVGLDDVGRGVVAPAGASVSAGAGQFAASLGEGVARFVDSWGLYLGAVSDDCSIVGNSVGQAEVDFRAVDAAASLPSYLLL